MYKNLVWFTAGYITCKHIVPIVNGAIVKANAKLKEETAKQDAAAS